MAFINTSDVLGEQATFDAIVSKQITEFNDNRITKLFAHAFRNCLSLVSVDLPNVTKVNDSGFKDCPNLEYARFTKKVTFGTDNFENCSKLKALILEYEGNGNNDVCLLSGTNMLSGTPLKVIDGFCYVPNSMLAKTKASDNNIEFRHIIRSIDDYPIGNDASTISLTWTQIKAAIDDESFFSGNYAVGDIKKFTYNDGTTEQVCYAEIRYIDTVNKYVDFVMAYGIESVPMLPSANETNKKYSESNAKARLDEIYANELQSDLKNIITPVTKQYYCYDDTTEQVTASLWLMNSQNAGFTGSYLKENDPNDHALFDDTLWRRKTIKTTKLRTSYWIGSAIGSRYPTRRVVCGGGGTPTDVSSNTSSMLIFGFRIQKTTT